MAFADDSSPHSRAELEIKQILESQFIDHEFDGILDICMTEDKRVFGRGALEREGVKDMRKLVSYMRLKRKVTPKEYDYEFLFKVLALAGHEAEVDELRDCIEKYKATNGKGHQANKRPRVDSIQHEKYEPTNGKGHQAEKRLRVDSIQHGDSTGNTSTVDNNIEFDGPPRQASIQPYQFNGSQLVILINNFTSGISSRDGTERDEDKLKSFIGQLNDNGCRSEYRPFRDRTKDQIMGILDDTRDELAKGKHDRVLLFIFSHGVEDGVEGFYSNETERTETDSDRVIKIDDIVKKLDVLSMKGKPKLIFINACNGPGANVVQLVQSDSISSTQLQQVESDFPPKLMKYYDPQYADVLISCASAKGYKAYRHSAEGAWYINVLIEVFEIFFKTHHLLELITHMQLLVSGKVGLDSNSRPNEHVGQMPIFRSTLRRPLYLVPWTHIQRP